MSSSINVTRHAFEMMLLLLLPLIVSFVFFLVATATSATLLPTVGYGLIAASSTNGVSYIWCATLTCSSTDPALPTILLNAINAILILTAILGALFIGFRLGQAIIEQQGSRRGGEQY
jgi:hypothetical protein